MKPVPEYWTEFTALAPIALSAACNKLLASCAAAGGAVINKIISSIPVLVLMLSSLFPEWLRVATESKPPSAGSRFSFGLGVVPARTSTRIDDRRLPVKRTRRPCLRQVSLERQPRRQP